MERLEVQNLHNRAHFLQNLVISLYKGRKTEKYANFENKYLCIGASSSSSVINFWLSIPNFDIYSKEKNLKFKAGPPTSRLHNRPKTMNNKELKR